MASSCQCGNIARSEGNAEEGILCHREQSAAAGAAAVHAAEAPEQSRDQARAEPAEELRIDRGQRAVVQAGQHLQAADHEAPAAARGRQLHGQGARGHRGARPGAVR